MARMPQRDATRRQDAQGLWLLIFACVIAAAGTGAYLYVRATSQPVDPDTLCPIKGSEGQLVVLMDRTDALSTAQREDLRNKLRDIRDSLPPKHEMSIYAVGETGERLLSPLLTRCNPGSPDEANGLYQNKDKIRRAWQSGFMDPFDSVIHQITESDLPMPRSPIMESIQSVAISAFNSHRPSAPRRLVIVSDMLQNTPEFSHYKHFEPFRQFRDTDYYRRLKPDLLGVNVTIIFIRRDRTIPAAKLIEFWQAYFADSGAQVDNVKAVQG